MWFHQECKLQIGTEDGSGGYTPFTAFEFAQGIEVRQLRREQTDMQPGKASPDYGTIPMGWQIDIGCLYARQAEDFIPFTDRTKRFRVALNFTNPAYSGIAPFENDPHAFRDASASVEAIELVDNAETTARVMFRAERME